MDKNNLKKIAFKILPAKAPNDTKIQSFSGFVYMYSQVIPYYYVCNKSKRNVFFVFIMLT